MLLYALRDSIATSQTPAGGVEPLNRNTNAEPYEDNEELFEPVTEVEVTVDDNKEVNQKP